MIEACTVASSTKGAALDNIVALVDLGIRALAVADELLTDHNATSASWVMFTPAEPSREGHRRHTVGATHRTKAAVAAGVVTGVLLGALATRVVVPVLLDSPSLPADDAAMPEVLSGKIPVDWITAHPERHQRGSDRQPQRAAYLAGQTVPTAPIVRALPTVRPTLATVPPATGARGPLHPAHPHRRPGHR